MKYLIAVLLLVFSISSGAQDTVVISGNIRHRLSDSVALSYNDNYIAYYPKEYYASIDKKGNFSLQFTVPKGVYIEANLVHGNKIAELLLHGGDRLYLSADAARFDSSLGYRGRGADVANFIQKHTIEKGRMNAYTIKLKTAINRDPKEFLKEIEADRQDEIRFLDKYKADLPKELISYWEAYYRYYNYFFLQQYPQVHELIRRRRYTDTIPEENYSVLKAMPDTFSDAYLQVPSYLLYLTGVFDVRLKAAGYDHPGLSDAMRLEVEDSILSLSYKLLPPGSGAYFVAQNIYGRIRYQDIARTEKQIAAFKQHWPASEYLQLLDKGLATAKRLTKGQPAPDIVIADSDGVKKRLSDLKGQVVYVTFWASWCKQCVAEMVNGRHMKTLFNGKPVTFVYVSIDDDAAAAQKLVQQYKLDGAFVCVKGGWNATETKLYGVQRLPAYFLVDQDGKFATQNPPSPAQSTQLSVAISQLLK